MKMVVMIQVAPIFLLLSLSCVANVSSFSIAPEKGNKILLPNQKQHPVRHSQQRLQASSTKQENDVVSTIDNENTEEDGAEYKNAATSVLSNFMQTEGEESLNPVLSAIAFDATKSQKLPIENLASILDYELYNKEWFVTGNVNPIYFSDDFEFQDPDVKLSGIENYAKAVNKLFDQGTSRAEIISTKVMGEDTLREDTITVTWRLSGKVNIGPFGGLTINPYIVYTDFTIDNETGLIIFQEDRFEIQQWDILLSALFPFLIGKITSDPAPPVEKRDVVMPKTNGSGGGLSMPTSLTNLFGNKDKEGGLSMADVKKFGISGTLAYVLTELAFWAVAFPVASTALYSSTGHWPDVINDSTDRGTVLGFIFAGANIARLLVPLRLGAALALAPWVDENIINREEK
mmetsp:Transcript_62690/g.70107  ORF Transcript_62690/g.70107 Transcript_62690/m.70107 type:complete len:403 (-) Transcript_62690:444-1652(-)